MIGRAVLIACVVLLVVSGNLEAAQEPSNTQRLLLRDGSVLFGTVAVAAEDHIVFRTISGTEVQIARDAIVSIEPAKGDVVAGEFQPSDPNATRLLFAPTGRALRRGDGYVGVYEIYLPFVQVGITDRISIGGGTPFFFGLAENERPFWLTPRCRS